MKVPALASLHGSVSCMDGQNGWHAWTCICAKRSSGGTGTAGRGDGDGRDHQPVLAEHPKEIGWGPSAPAGLPTGEPEAGQIIR